MLNPGVTFANAFEVVRVFGKTTSGYVYKVTDRASGARSTLMVLHEHLAGAATFVETPDFLSEHAVAVVRAGRDETGNRPWALMEHLDAESLDWRVERDGALSPTTARTCARELGWALRDAHRVGELHTMLTPTQLFVARVADGGEALKVLGFGFRALPEAQRVAEQVFLDDLAWKAPEQLVRGGSANAAVDVWRFGLVVYWLFTGRAFWRACEDPSSSVLELCGEIVNASPLERATWRAREQGVADRLPDGFDGWFARCVVRDASARWPNSAEASQALDALLEGNASAHMTPPMTPTGTYATWTEHPPPSQRPMATPPPPSGRGPFFTFGIDDVLGLLHFDPEAPQPSKSARPTRDDDRPWFTAYAPSWVLRRVSFTLHVHVVPRRDDLDAIDRAARAAIDAPHKPAARVEGDALRRALGDGEPLTATVDGDGVTWSVCPPQPWRGERMRLTLRGTVRDDTPPGRHVVLLRVCAGGDEIVGEADLTLSLRAHAPTEHRVRIGVGVASALASVAIVAGAAPLGVHPALGGVGSVAALAVGGVALRPVLSPTLPPTALRERPSPTIPPRRGDPAALAARLRRACEHLIGPPLERACRALMEAFPSYGELDQLTTIELSTPLAMFSPPRALPDVVFELLRRCVARGDAARLLAGAATRRGDHPTLAAVVAELTQSA